MQPIYVVEERNLRKQLVCFFSVEDVKGKFPG